ncbi:uncharacterized protein LOC123319322 [Coccinella septempunctata]|uniref:uncharacterized protein LOC123319322 n=1 Tax=Coccinella septempunctata TaxID=41139 RepID=UPI001D0739A5|nr:uncharacterized protein LOC123319322 [Coccinella septempunctata]
MLSREVIVVALSLLAIQAATVRCQKISIYPEELPNGLPRHIRSLSLTFTNELKSPVNTSITSLIDSIVSKFLDTKLGQLVAEAIFDTPVFVTKVNNILGSKVLILEKNSLRISYANLIEVIKIHITDFLENHLKLRGILLNFAGGFVSRTVDDFGRKIEPAVKQVNFTVSTKPSAIQGTGVTSAQSVIRKIIQDFIVLLIRPFQSRLNQTLLNVTNELLSLYKPVLPSNYFQSIISCGINQSVLKTVEIVEAAREMLNHLLANPNRVMKRSVDSLESNNEKQTRSLIGLIVAPIRFLLTLILTPVHRLLKRLMNYIFVTLRPVVGKFILSPIESIVMSIINLIPCSNC